MNDSCRLLGNYNGENIYLYSSAKYDRPRLFYTPNYYFLPKWVEDHEKLTLFQAVKIINYRMKNKNSDNLKPENLKIDTVIESVMRKDAPASDRRLKGTLERPLGQATPCAADVKNKK